MNRMFRRKFGIGKERDIAVTEGDNHVEGNGSGNQERREN